VYLLAFHAFLLGILIFEGLTARRPYKSFGVKGLSHTHTGFSPMLRMPYYRPKYSAIVKIEMKNIYTMFCW
jgi:hypothetical protein